MAQDTRSARQGRRTARSAPAGGGLGTTGNRSSDVIEVDQRRRRWELRDKGREYADRTLVWKPSLVTADGTVIEEREVPRGDKYLACGARPRSMMDGVGLHAGQDGQSAGYSDLQRCGSVWSCAVCSAQIMQARNVELRQVASYAREEGHTLAMPTFTISHKRGDSLASEWDAIASGWASVTSGSQWVSETVEAYTERLEKWELALELARAGAGRYPRNGRKYVAAIEAGDMVASAGYRPRRRVGDQERFGILGWARVVEVRDNVDEGGNGWHVHVHVVMVVKSGAGAVVRAKMAGVRMLDRWLVGIRKAGFDADRAHGAHVRVDAAAAMALEDYITKQQDSDAETAQRKRIRDALGVVAGQVAAEATMGHHKLGKRGSLSPFQILAAIDYDGDPERAAVYEARWREWVRDSEGRRQMTWSKGLRELAGLAEEARSDQEIVDDDRGGELVLTFELDAWEVIRKGRLQLTILEVLEREGVAALRAMLDEDGLRYYLPRAAYERDQAAGRGDPGNPA